MLRLLPPFFSALLGKGFFCVSELSLQRERERGERGGARTVVVVVMGGDITSSGSRRSRVTTKTRGGL